MTISQISTCANVLLIVILCAYLLIPFAPVKTIAILCVIYCLLRFVVFTRFLSINAARLGMFLIATVKPPTA